MKKFSILAIAALSTGIALADMHDTDINIDILALASNGMLNENMAGVKVLSPQEEQEVFGGHRYQLGWYYTNNIRNWYYHQQALKEGRPTIYRPIPMLL